MELSHILIISYYWPPDNSSGVQRWAYFAHFLNRAGYDVEVVTVDPKKASYKNTDSSFTSLVSEVKTHTTSTFELLKTYSLLTTGDSKKGIPRGSVDDKNNLLKKLANKVKADFFVPDARVGWNNFAFKKAESLVKKDTIVITTGPPHSTHLIGLKLKNCYPKNTWIADFRDPWLELYSNKNQPQSRWASNKNTKLELSVLEKADVITTVGPSLVKLLQNKVSNKSKVHFFYNGFDEDKMNSLSPMKQDGFVITFIGLLAEDYNITGFVRALNEVVNQKQKITLKLAGNIASSFLDEVEKIKGLTVDYEGFVSHDRSLTLMKSASLLFTILPSQPQDEIIISGKLMEYLSTGIPILCIGNKMGDAAALINECNAGKVVNHEESEKMKEFIIENINANKTSENSKDITRYSREKIARQLALFLNTL